MEIKDVNIAHALYVFLRMFYADVGICDTVYSIKCLSSVLCSLSLIFLRGFKFVSKVLIDSAK